MNTSKMVSLQTLNGWAILPSSLKRPDGLPRFNLNFPAHFFNDVGAQHLVGHETGDGYELPTRNLIERALRNGDLFVDVGAHWGLFSLQAATHPAGNIRVCSFEPDLMNATILSTNTVRNGVSEIVTSVCAACGDRPELAALVTNSTMGHSIRGVGLPQPEHFKGATKWVPVVTLDTALGSLSDLAERRVILKIDAEGFEPNVIAGAASLIRSGRVALIVWECGLAFTAQSARDAMIEMTGVLGSLGFRHFLPPDNGDDPPSVAFDPAADYCGNVFSCAPALMNELGLISRAA
jgi:FkbM family methyltransferase